MTDAPRMAGVELDIENEFLTHTTKPAGSFLSGEWKKDGEVVVWLSPMANVISLWRHSWWILVDEGDEEDDDYDGPPIKAVRTMRANCFETEALLKNMVRERAYAYKDDKDRFEFRPMRCPICKAADWVYERVNSGSLNWTAEILKFGEDEPVIVHAGGFCGMFNRRDLSDSEKRQLREAGIKQTEAFMEKGYPRQQYLCSAMRDDSHDAGWVFAVESQTLGDKLKKQVEDEQAQYPEDEPLRRILGHYKYNPYPFRWKYDENLEFSNKYDVLALTKRKVLTDDQVRNLYDLYKDGDREGVVEKVKKWHAKGELNSKVSKTLLDKLFVEKPPSFNQLREYPNLRVLYDGMKEAAQIDMPVDDFFADAVEAFGMPEPESDDDSSDRGEAFSDAPEVGSRAPETVDGESDDSSDQGDDELEEPEETIPCDHCGAPMGGDDLLCEKCGTEYVIEETEGEEDATSYMVRRPCANPDCMEKKVPSMPGEPGCGKCPQCGAMHDEKWNFELPKKDKPKPQGNAAARRGRKSASASKQQGKRPPARKAARESKAATRRSRR